MSLGELFSIHATNIGHAALRTVEVPLDSSADARLMPVAGAPDQQVAVLVTADGYRAEFPISEARVRKCIGSEGLYETQRYVDELAAAMQSALEDAVGC